ncbi:MAG: hypothetical protein AB2A00_27445 [Myxococcota bacterium]
MILTAWAVGAVFIFLRSLPFLLFPEIHFDADQATIGLMALRLAHLEDFPIFMYGQKYMMAPTAYLAAPIFVVTGASIAVLKSIELLFNLATLALLLRQLVRDAGLTPWQALAASSWLVLPSVVTGTRLVESTGGNIQPFFWILLLWELRQKGALLGVVIAFGVLNRELTLFGVTALLVVELAFERQLSRAYLVRRARTLAAYVVINTVFVELARRSVDYRGTRPWLEPPTLESAARNLVFLVENLLPALLGVAPGELRHTGIRADGPSGTPGMAGVMYLLLALGGCLLAGLTLRRLRGGVPALASCGHALYLVGAGVQSMLAFVLVLPWAPDGGMVRFILLALLLLVGITELVMQDLPRARAVVSAVCVVAAVLQLGTHVTFWREAYTHPPAPHFQPVVDELKRQGIHHALSDYWTAYPISFLSNEEIRVATSTRPARIRAYQQGYRDHLAEAVDIQPEPCAEGLERFVVGELHVCRATDPERAIWK